MVLPSTHIISLVCKPFCLMSQRHHKKRIVPIPFPRNDSLTPVGPNDPLQQKSWED